MFMFYSKGRQRSGNKTAVIGSLVVYMKGSKLILFSFHIYVYTRLAGVGGLSENTKYSFRPFEERLFANVRDKNIAFLWLREKVKFWVVIVLVLFKVYNCWLSLKAFPKPDDFCWKLSGSLSKPCKSRQNLNSQHFWRRAWPFGTGSPAVPQCIHINDKPCKSSVSIETGTSCHLHWFLLAKTSEWRWFNFTGSCKKS